MNTKMKSLFSYIFPALGGLFVTYLYNVVDGIFVGQGVGSAALGAFNIGVPFITSVVAIAAMFPMGGAANAIAISRGIIIKSLAVFCIPVLFGSDAIWIAPFIAETLTLVLAVRLKKASRLIYQ